MGVLVLEAGVGALARLYEEQVGPELKWNLNRTFLETYSVRSRETAAIDQMQKEVSTTSNFCIVSKLLESNFLQYGTIRKINTSRYYQNVYPYSKNKILYLVPFRK